MRLVTIILLIPFLVHAESVSETVKPFEIIDAREDYYVFTPTAKTEDLMVDYLNGEGCSIEDEIEGCLADPTKVKSLIHRDLKIKSHPLDRLLSSP